MRTMSIRANEAEAGRNGGQRGFSLLELMISVGFMSLLAGLITGSSFLSIKTGAETGAVADIAVQTATTSRWLVRDIHRAEDSQVTVPSAGSSAASFTWDDGVMECTLSLDGTNFVRECGGSTMIIGRYISDLTFQRNGRLITASYQISPPKSASRTEQINLNIALGGG